MIEGVEINFYLEDGHDVSLPLTPTQTLIVLRALGLKVKNLNENQVEINSFGDEMLKEYILPKIPNYVEIEQD